MAKPKDDTRKDLNLPEDWCHQAKEIISKTYFKLGSIKKCKDITDFGKYRYVLMQEVDKTIKDMKYQPIVSGKGKSKPERYYIIKEKNGMVSISRHKKPDFVCGAILENRDLKKEFQIVAVDVKWES